MKRQTAILIAAALAMSALGVHAADNSYIGSVGTGNWNDTTVWSSGAIPTSTDSVLITNAVSADRNLTNGLASTLIADLVISNSSAANKNTLIVFAPASGMTFFSVTGDTTIGSDGVLNLARGTANTTINVTNENLYLLDNALIRASASSQYTVNYIVNGAFSNSAQSTISVIRG